MRKILVFIFIAASSLLLSGCSLKNIPAAVQINSTPSANVFINGKSAGKTPYYGNDLKEGEVTIKLIPESTTDTLVPWEGKLKLNSGVLTLIDREFGTSENVSSGEVLTLEKTKDAKSASLSIISDPDSSLVKIDGESKGFTPLSLDKIEAGEHEIIVSKEGYTEKGVKAKAVNGYRLIINLKLSQEAVATPTPELTPSLSLTTTPSKNKVTPSPAKTSPTPGKNTPTPSAAGETTEVYVLIKDTPTGWLRVRSGPSTGSAEVAKVNPGEKYLLLDEKSGWYKIQYEERKEGWISSTYAQKQ